MLNTMHNRTILVALSHSGMLWFSFIIIIPLCYADHSGYSALASLLNSPI